MEFFLFSLVIAAIVCGIMWRRPDARAFAGGAWQAGKQQAVREFREGYDFAQQRLRAGNPSWKNPRRWTSWALAGAYGAAKTLAAATRIGKRAWRGGRDRYRDWKAAQPVDAEVVDVEVVPDEPETPQPAPAPEEQPSPDPDPTPDDPPHADPEPGAETQPQEEPEVQTEAAGLTSYAAAHNDLANELQSRMSGIESLAASMTGVLAEHSDLIGNSAVMQDLLNQAASVAQQTAARALEVANN